MGTLAIGTLFGRGTQVGSLCVAVAYMRTRESVDELDKELGVTDDVYRKVVSQQNRLRSEKTLKVDFLRRALQRAAARSHGGSGFCGRASTNTYKN